MSHGGGKSGVVARQLYDQTRERLQTAETTIAAQEAALARKDRILAAIGEAPDDACPWIVVKHNPNDPISHEGGRANIVARLEVGKR